MKFLTVVSIVLLLFSANSYAAQDDLQTYTLQLQQALEIDDHLKVAEAIKGLRSLGVEDPRLDFFEGRAQYHNRQGRKAARLIDAYLEASPGGEYAAEARQLKSGMSKVLDAESYAVANESLATLRQKTLPKFKEQALDNLMQVAPHSAYALEKLCVMYTKGYYVEQDFSKARAYCESAYQIYRNGSTGWVAHTAFLQKIAHMKRYGFGGDEQIAEATKIYEELVQKAEKDHERAEALSHVAEIYLYGQDIPDCDTALSILPKNTVSRVWSKFTAFLKARIVLEETCEIPSGVSWETLDYAESVLWKNEKVRAFVYAMTNDRQESYKQVCSSDCTDIAKILAAGDNALNEAYRRHVPVSNPTEYLADTYEWKLPYPHEETLSMVARAALLVADALETGRYAPYMPSGDRPKTAADHLEMARLFGANVEERLTTQHAKSEELDAINETIRQAATYAVTSRIGLKKIGKFDYVAAAALDPAGQLLIRSVDAGSGSFRLQAIDMNTARIVRNYRKMKVYPTHIAMSPAGGTFAISDTVTAAVQFYDVNKEKPIHLVKTNGNSTRGREFGGSLGRMLIASSSSPWSIKGMSALRKDAHWSINKDRVDFLGFSPSGRRFAYNFANGLVVADSDTGRDMKTFNVDGQPYRAVFLSEDVVFTPSHDILNLLDGSVTKKGAFIAENTDGKSRPIFYRDLSTVRLAGGGRWLVAGHGNKVLILNPLSMEVAAELEMGVGDQSHIKNIVTTANPRFILVHFSDGMLHRLEWTGMAEAANVPTIAQVLAEEAEAASVARATPAAAGAFAPCEAGVNGMKITIHDEDACKKIAMQGPTPRQPSLPVSTEGPRVTASGGGLFGRAPVVRQMSDKKTQKCQELGIEDMAECRKYHGKSLLGQKRYESRLRKQRGN